VRLVPRALSLPRRAPPPLWETTRAANQGKDDTQVVLPEFSHREESPEGTEGGALRCGSPQRSRTSAMREGDVAAHQSKERGPSDLQTSLFAITWTGS